MNEPSVECFADGLASLFCSSVCQEDFALTVNAKFRIRRSRFVPKNGTETLIMQSSVCSFDAVKATMRAYLPVHLWTFAMSMTMSILSLPQLATAFQVTIPHSRSLTLPRRPVALDSNSGSATSENGFFDRESRAQLNQRIRSVQREILDEEWRRPPNAKCSPEELVEEILTALWDYDDPLPDSGFLLMLRTATKHWREQILKSVGAPPSGAVDWQLVSSALGAAIGRPRNQFGILVAGEAEDPNEIPYLLEFPFEPLDYSDGTAWLECRMREKQTNELLVITGWTLKQREDGAWLVDGISWHDLRDQFRPGIGQTEWMRVCR